MDPNYEYHFYFNMGIWVVHTEWNMWNNNLKISVLFSGPPSPPPHTHTPASSSNGQASFSTQKFVSDTFYHAKVVIHTIFIVIKLSECRCAK